MAMKKREWLKKGDLMAKITLFGIGATVVLASLVVMAAFFLIVRPGLQATGLDVDDEEIVLTSTTGLIGIPEKLVSNISKLLK